MTNYIKNSNPCMHAIIPNIVKAKIKEYKKKKKPKKWKIRLEVCMCYTKGASYAKGSTQASGIALVWQKKLEGEGKK